MIHGHKTTAEQPDGNTDHWRGHEGEYDTCHQPGNEGPNWEEIADVERPDAAGPDDEVHNIPNRNSEPPANASPRETSHMATANASSREASHRVTTRSRYGWIIKPTTRMVESHEQARTRRNHNIALYSNVEGLNESLSVDLNQSSDSMDNPMALVSQVGDTMHLQQAMKQPDQAKFLKAMEEEVTTHERRGHWKIVPIAAVPKGEKILDSIWAMRRMRCIGTGEVWKYKARLNAHGGQQVHGVNFWEIFALVVKWTTIRLLLTLIMTHEWKSRQSDFVLAYLQADVEGDIYMRMPKGFKLKDGRDRHSHILTLVKNIYGLNKQGECGINISTKV